MGLGKRMTDINKWDRPWFQNLPIKYKLLWLYILDKCDMSGVWYVNLKMAGISVGGKFEEKETLKIMEKQITSLNCGSRWQIKDYIRFQYGDFSERSPVHKAVSKCADGNGIKHVWGSTL